MALITRLAGRLLRRGQRQTDTAGPAPSAEQAGFSPPSADAVADFNRGVEHFNSQRYDPAVGCFEAVIELRYDWADAHYYLGLAHYRLGQFEAASDALTMALCFAPEMAQAHFALALVEREQGKGRDALVSVGKAIDHGLSSTEAHNLRGALLLAAGDISGALRSFESAITVDPNCASAYGNLGYVQFRDCGEYESGARHIERALALDPENLDVLCNYTMVLSHRGEHERALALADRILSARSEMHEARLNRALTLLQLGRFEQAWDDYEARRVVRCNYNARRFPCAEWQGEDLNGKTILVHGEQGLGDEIMFASCFPDLIARAGRCVIECEPRLEQLFKRSFTEAKIVSGKQSAAFPEWWSEETGIDLHVPAGSLPRHFRRSRTAFPTHAGYLCPDSTRVAHWRDRLATLPPGLKIGISWRGGMQSTRRELRSIDLSAWVPILQTRGAQFVSLQYGNTSDECQRLMRECGTDLNCWPEAVDDLDETAALIAGLDLVVSVCTAVIHLAGALGRTVWILVPSCPEWRYQAAGKTMPWYPSARLIRQQVAGDWAQVITKVADEVGELTRERDHSHAGKRAD